MATIVQTAGSGSPFKHLGLKAGILRNYLYDLRRFIRTSFVTEARQREHRRALIYILSHSIEHGMSLSDPRIGFGFAKVTTLLAETQSYVAAYGLDDTAAMALKVLDAYIAFNATANTDMGDLRKALADLDARFGFRREQVAGGTEDVTLAGLQDVTNFDFLAFMEARHSVRQYADRPVTRAEIEFAVNAAQQTPSSCNRQTSRVYAFTDRTTIARVLSFQSGHRGFGHELGALVIVTADMAHLNTIGERNQGFVDGGMYAMTLALGFHAQAMGACMLNWSVTRETDHAMRTCAGIPENELVITMIGAGHLKENFKVPRSQRKRLGEVLQIDPPLQP